MELALGIFMLEVKGNLNAAAYKDFKVYCVRPSLWKNQTLKHKKELRNTTCSYLETNYIKVAIIYGLKLNTKTKIHFKCSAL